MIVDLAEKCVKPEVTPKQLPQKTPQVQLGT